jgi:hypothetical protein
MPAVNHSVKMATSLMVALKAHGALTALIGVGTACRLYSGRAAQGSALPRVIWHEITSTPEHTHDSATTSDPGIEDSIVQFDVEGRTLSGCRAVADAISEALNGAKPAVGVADIQAAFRESGGFAQAMDYQTGDGVTEAHRLSVDYRLMWRDA